MSDLLAGVAVSRETIVRLEKFAEMVLKWTSKINLIGRSSGPDIWNRHVVDSVQIYGFAPDRFDHWVDLGSGGGFPGVVIAALAKVDRPEAKVTLIESDQRKATFLRAAGRELGLSITVIAERIERVPAQSADVISARALAPLADLLPLVSLHLKPDGRAILPKGRNAAAEVATASSSWSFALEDHPSFTDPAARLLLLQRIEALGVTPE